MTGGKLSVSTDPTSAHDAYALYPADSACTVTGGELFASGATGAIKQDKSGASISISYAYEYAYNMNPVPSDPPFTDGTAAPYTYSASHKYLHVRPLTPVTPVTLEFNSAVEGYTPIATQALTISNHTSSRKDLTITMPSSFVTEPGIVWVSLLAGESKTVYVRPMDGLSIDNYLETIRVGNVYVPLHFEVKGLPPVITRDPVDAGDLEGASVSFEVAATSELPMRFQWLQSADGVTYTNASGTSTNSTYTVVANSSTDGNRYKCRVTNDAGSVESAVATLSMWEPLHIAGPQYNSVLPGYPSFQVGPFTLTGSGTLRVRLDTDHNSHTLWESTYKKLVVEEGLPAGTYPVTLTLSSSITELPETTFTYTLYVSSLTTSVAPTGTLYRDTPVTLTANALGAYSPSYQWYTGNTPITGANTAQYVPTITNEGDYAYTCRMSDSGHNFASTASFRVEERLQFTDDPALDVPAGEHGAALTPIDVSGNVLGGVGARAFSLEGGAPSWLQISDAGVLSGTRPDTAQAAAAATVRVQDSASPYESKTITIAIGEVYGIVAQPGDEAAVTGQTATFSIVATGSGLTYQWYEKRNGSVWRPVGGNAPRYTTPALTMADNGNTYYCIVTNRFGTPQESAVATLRVSKSVVPPQTGDAANPTLWLLLALCSGALFVLIKARSCHKRL